MRHGGGFRFLAALFVMGVVAFFATGAFVTGFVVGAASNGATATGWGHGGVISVLLTILIALIIFRMIGFMIFGHHRRMWGHHPYWHGEFYGPRFGPGAGPATGHGDWHKDEWRQVSQAWFDDFHSRSHGAASTATGGSPADDKPTDQPR